MTKGIKKRQECVNLEGLVDYEKFYITQIALGNTQDNSLTLNEISERIKSTYCGSQCFYRHGCQLAERYLTNGRQ